MRNTGMMKTKITMGPEEYGNLSCDPRYDVWRTVVLDDEAERFLVRYKERDEFVEEHDCSNIGGFLFAFVQVYCYC